MKKVLFIAALAVLVMLTNMPSAVVQGRNEDAEVAKLREVHRKYLDAWSTRDIDTIVDIGTGAAGYGHSTAFPRPVRISEPFRRGVTAFYDMMDVFTIEVLTENYRVVGDTGLVWGHYASTSKQKDGPQRVIYQRYAHTFARIDGEWKLVMYHRSLLPTEDTQ